MTIQIKSMEEFIEQIKGIAMIKFYSNYSTFSKEISNEFDRLLLEYQINGYKVDVDQVPEIAKKCDIKAMPTFQLYKNGELVGIVIGSDIVKLRQLFSF
jgi:thioredoxin 1